MEGYYHIKRILELGDLWEIVANGESMYPTFISPQRLIIQREVFRKGDCVLVYSPKLDYRIHRIVRIEENKYRLKGDGSIFQEECIDEDHILGVVVGFYYKNKRRVYRRGKTFYILSRMTCAISLMKCFVPFRVVQHNKVVWFLSSLYLLCCDAILFSLRKILTWFCSDPEMSENSTT